MAIPPSPFPASLPGVAVSVDVAFTNIVNEDSGAGIGDMIWRGLPLQGREFGTGDILFNDGVGYFPDASFGTAAQASIYGRLYGPGHEEVGGLFHRNGIAGAFAGKTRSLGGLLAVARARCLRAAPRGRVLNRQGNEGNPALAMQCKKSTLVPPAWPAPGNPSVL